MVAVLLLFSGVFALVILRGTEPPGVTTSRATTGEGAVIGMKSVQRLALLMVGMAFSTFTLCKRQSNKKQGWHVYTLNTPGIINMTRIVPAIALGFLFSSFSLYASPVGYRINPQETAITLSWQAFGDMSQARLGNVTGDITLNAGNDSDDTVHVSIPVAGLNASNPLLTWQMKSSLFFDAERYPNITFTSSRVVALGQGHYRILGTLAVKNIARPVILDALLNDKTTGPENISLHASTTISRSAFNMASFAAVVDDHVTINIAIQARLHRAV